MTTGECSGTATMGEQLRGRGPWAGPFKPQCPLPLMVFHVFSLPWLTNALEQCSEKNTGKFLVRPSAKFQFLRVFCLGCEHKKPRRPDIYSLFMDICILGEQHTRTEMTMGEHKKIFG